MNAWCVIGLFCSVAFLLGAVLLMLSNGREWRGELHSEFDPTVPQPRADGKPGRGTP
jgi:hypothetical protein